MRVCALRVLLFRPNRSALPDRAFEFVRWLVLPPREQCSLQRRLDRSDQRSSTNAGAGAVGLRSVRRGLVRFYLDLNRADRVSRTA